MALLEEMPYLQDLAEQEALRTPLEE
ncbi:hypothetical protein CCAN2_570001 [Capnocytophaga canimorsus]|nr:hypothetical protein CCAN2_570001 [Capnocytophaga canimorsus]